MMYNQSDINEARLLDSLSCCGGALVLLALPLAMLAAALYRRLVG